MSMDDFKSDKIINQWLEENVHADLDKLRADMCITSNTVQVSTLTAVLNQSLRCSILM